MTWMWGTNLHASRGAQDSCYATVDMGLFFSIYIYICIHIYYLTKFPLFIYMIFFLFRYYLFIYWDPIEPLHGILTFCNYEQGTNSSSIRIILLFNIKNNWYVLKINKIRISSKNQVGNIVKLASYLSTYHLLQTYSDTIIKTNYVCKSTKK